MPLYPPPPRTPVDPAKILAVVVHPGCELFRVYDPQSRYKPGPRTFRFNGPRGRFDHHREIAGAPANDPDRGIYYAAYDLEGALVEVFGDPPRIVERGTYRVVRARLQDRVRLLDIRGRGAMLAGTAAGVSGTDARHLTQSWSRYFYENSEVYRDIDGLLYANSHNGMDAIALFERAQPAIINAIMKTSRLTNPALEAQLLRIADRNGLTVA